MKKFIKLMCLFSIGLLIPMLIVNADCSSNITAPLMVEYDAKVINPNGAKTYNINSNIPKELGFTIPYNSKLSVKEEYDVDVELYGNVQNGNESRNKLILVENQHLQRKKMKSHH